jgi:phosphoserine phosphatase RsbU/P
MRLRAYQIGKDFSLEEPCTLIGRNPDCAVLLESDTTSISRKHAEIRSANGMTEIRDLGSRNGTLLNGDRLVPNQWYIVSANDRLQICDHNFLFFEDALPDQIHGSCIMVPSPESGTVVPNSSIPLSKLIFAKVENTDRQRQLKALLKMTDALRGILTTHDVLARAAEILLDIFPGVDRSLIGFVDRMGIFTPRWWHLRHQDHTSEIRISQTVVRQVFDSADAILSNDASENFADAESVHALSLKSIMCAPLLDEDSHVIGIVYVDARSVAQFTSLDLEVLAMVATQISLATSYSRLHEQSIQDRVLLLDLARAREVQLQYLPRQPPSIPGYHVTCFYRAARQIGGDYYDFIQRSDGRVALVQADVEGKGAAAALTMVQLATETRAGVEISDSAADLVTRMNRRMNTKWITFAALYLDPKSHQIQLANAAHEFPLLRRVSGCVEELTQNVSSTPLSVIEGEVYQQESLQLMPREMLVIFSDGFPDAEQARTETRFGKQRLIELLKNCDGQVEDFSECAVHAVDEFRGESEQFDDMCMLCVRRV